MFSLQRPAGDSACVKALSSAGAGLEVSASGAERRRAPLAHLRLEEEGEERGTGCSSPSRVWGGAQGEGAQQKAPHFGRRPECPLPSAYRGLLASPQPRSPQPFFRSLQAFPRGLTFSRLPKTGGAPPPLLPLSPSSCKEFKRVRAEALKTTYQKLQVQWQSPCPSLRARAKAVAFPHSGGD